MKHKNQALLLIFIFFLALIPRLIYFYFSDIDPLSPPDSSDYKNLAISILNKFEYRYPDGQLCSQRPPFYPFFLSIIFLCCGYNLKIVQFSQIILNVLSCIILFLIAQILFKNRIISFIITCLFIFYLPLIERCYTLMSEILFNFLIIISCFFMLYFLYNNRIIYLWINSLFLGLSTLTRPYVIFFSFISLIFLFKILKENKKKFKICFLYCLIFAIILCPWFIRNYITFKNFFLVSSGGGIVFWLGTDYISDGIDHKIIDGQTPYNRAYKLVSPLDPFKDYQSDRIFYKLGWENIKNYPFKYSKLVIKKFFRVLGITTVYNNWKYSFIPAIIQFLIFISFLSGIIVLIINKQFDCGKLYVILFIFYSIIFHSLFTYAKFRFGLPIIPLLFLFSGYFIYFLTTKKQSREK